MLDAFLLIEKGDPHELNSLLTLSGGDRFLLGRSWTSNHPDLAFASLCVSRKHALITVRDGSYYITDLDSKHGTAVNGRLLNHESPCQLRHGDRIDLARGTALLVFNNPLEFASGDTVELTGAFPGNSVPCDTGLTVYPERREILLEGRPVTLVGKDLELFLLLFENRNAAVSYDQIKQKVWPERTPGLDNIPDVGNDEITVLVYRIRKRLGTAGQSIVALPRFGYMLDLP